MSVKSSVLALLEARKGQYLSGEELASRFSCSRAAIWKAVKALREEGYQIRAVTNRGYILEKSSSLLSPEAVAAYPGFPPVPVFVYKEVSSTNQLLKQKALSSEFPLPDGTLLLAETQKAGRGHGKRTFYSPAGSGLYFSLLYHPKGSIRQSLSIAASAASAVYEAVLEEWGVALEIKWVNDLYRDGKKVCGILTEAISSFETGEIEFIIVGFGLNICDPQNGFPDSLKESAASVLPHGLAPNGQPVNRSRLAAAIAVRFLALVRQGQIPESYRTRNIVPGKEILTPAPSGGPSSVPARALEILEDGRLLIQYPDGQQEALICGEIRLR